MRRKSPIQQWVDSLPQGDQPSNAGPSVARGTSEDDISLVEDNGNSVTSPILLRAASVPSPLSLPPSADSKERASLTDKANAPADSPAPSSSNANEQSATSLCDNATARTKAIASNLELDLYSSSGDISFMKRPSRSNLMRERSTNSEGNSPRHRHPLFRESSLQSESNGSRCSSVESLLESRRVDAEAVLRGVGFGPSPARLQLARIPDRFLKPSLVNGVNTEQFIKEEHKSMKMHECGVFGYRGLTEHCSPICRFMKSPERGRRRYHSGPNIPTVTVESPTRSTFIDSG